jgi:tetratricopeptide (TPR) repeat protein
MLEIRQNIDNVRAAIRWAAQHEPHSLDLSLAQIFMLFDTDGWNIEAETTFRLIVDQLLPDCIDPPNLEDKEVQQRCLHVATYQLALCRFQWRQYHMQEAEESGILALQWLPVVDELDFQEVRGLTILTLGLIKWGQGALVQALAYCQQAGELYQAAGDQISLGWALFYQNNLLQHIGEYDTAEECQKSVQYIAAKMDDPDLAILKWNELGKLATIHGQLDEAEAYFDKSLEQFAAATIPEDTVAYVLRERGEVSRLKGNYAQAKNYGQRSLFFAEDINLPHAISLSLWFLGNVAVDEGYFETALHYFAKFEQISTPLQELIGGPGWAFLGLGRLEEAGEQFSITLNKMIENRARPVGLDALVGMAHIKARTGQLEEALALLPLVIDHRSSHFESREKARKLRKELAAQLPSQCINKAEAKGRKMDLMQTAESLLAEVEATG